MGSEHRVGDRVLSGRVMSAIRDLTGDIVVCSGGMGGYWYCSRGRKGQVGPGRVR